MENFKLPPQITKKERRETTLLMINNMYLHEELCKLQLFSKCVLATVHVKKVVVNLPFIISTVFLHNI